MRNELTKEILEINPGEHLCLFYDKDPAEQMPALLPFVHEGLSKDEQFIYIADDQTIEELIERLQQSGVNVEAESRRGALKLWTRREWRQPGELSSEKKSLQVLDLIKASRASGFRGSRFAVEMTWTLGPTIDVPLLEHWEATINNIFLQDSRDRIICQYNRERLSPEVLFAALHTHPRAIIGEHIYPNLFYEAPLILDGNRNGNSAAARVDWMVGQLKRARAAQQQREELIEKQVALAQARLNKNKIEAILSAMPVAIYTCDLEGRITYYNQRAAAIWGREPRLDDPEQKFFGSYRLWRSDGSLLPHDQTPMARAVAAGEPTRDQEIIIERPDGSRVVVSVYTQPLFDLYGLPCGAINAFQDITARKQTETALRQAKEDLASVNAGLERRVQERTAALESAHAALLCEIEEQRRLGEQLRQAQRLESVGTLAGGVAHDFNNILNIIRGYSVLIGRQAAGNEVVRDALQVIEEEIERGAALVRQLLTVARKTDAQLTITHINDELSQLGSLLKQTLPKTIAVTMNLDAAVPALLADANQINQAILNICVNARDAMPAGGSIILTSKLVDGSSLPPEHVPPKAQQYVCIEVSDTGSGMEPSVRSRIFEPFFTTKGVGQGTGLGLAIVYSIMQNHQGFITVDSQPGQGSRFRLYFPVLLQPDTSDFLPLAEKEAAQSNGVPASATVLVAEDERAMADLLEKVLRERGHRVLVARDGEEVVHLFSNRTHEIDVVLLDIGLPKISGWDLISHIKEKQPKANIVVASGYLEPAIRAKMDQLGVKDLVQKPYVPEAMLDKLESLAQQKKI
ncbi:MAG TPA: MEDS domain-containing protein [Candidatus Binatia bacterium]|nr:MEDS domain-containing protein [Candidatus Binatia bacterium]